MDEIEVKVLDINKAEIINKLYELGAKKIFEGEVSDIFFDYANSQFLHSGMLLRLRNKGGSMFLTFKETIDKTQAKMMKEYEIELKKSDSENLRHILLRLGLIEKAKPSKHRVSFKLDGVTFEIDSYKGIPEFLEIEARDYETIVEYAAKLNINMEDTKPWNTYDVFVHYGKAY